MTPNDDSLSEEAQEMDDLIREVHQLEQAETGEIRAPGEIGEQPHPIEQELNIGSSIDRLFATTGGKIIWAAVILLFVLLALAYIPGWGTDAETASGGESVPETESSLGAAEQPQGDPADQGIPLSSAAGIYRLTTESARAAVGSGGYDFESAQGAIVVGEDGTVSGDFSYVFTGPYGGSQAQVTAEVTVDPNTSAPTLRPIEQGFTFDATLVVWFRIDPVDDDPYTNPGTELAVEGFVDPINGELLLAEGSDGSVFEFQR